MYRAFKLGIINFSPRRGGIFIAICSDSNSELRRSGIVILYVAPPELLFIAEIGYYKHVVPPELTLKPKNSLNATLLQLIKFFYYLCLS